jgi:hypothetical protein
MCSSSAAGGVQGPTSLLLPALDSPPDELVVLNPLLLLPARAQPPSRAQYPAPCSSAEQARVSIPCCSSTRRARVSIPYCSSAGRPRSPTSPAAQKVRTELSSLVL